MWITRHFSVIDVSLSLFFFSSTFRMHTQSSFGTSNCNILQIEMLRVCVSYVHIHAHVWRSANVCTSLSAHLKPSMFFVLCNSHFLFGSLFYTPHSIWLDFVCILCHRCIWVIICSLDICVYVRMCVKKNIFLCLYIDCQA